MNIGSSVTGKPLEACGFTQSLRDSIQCFPSAFSVFNYDYYIFHGEGDDMGKGFLKVQLYTGDYTVHGDPTTVLIKRNGEILFTLESDENGTTPAVTIECPDLDNEYGLDQKAYFTTVDVVVPKAYGFMQVNVYGVQIFDGIESILNVHLEPIVSGEPEEEDIYVPPQHGVDEDHQDTARPDNRPPLDAAVDVAKMEPIAPRDDLVPVFNPKPIDPDEYMQTFRPSDAPVPTSIPLANEVVIPEFITVHLGSPNANARNVRVRFRDYVVNVVCSEIYPFWHRNAIIANTHAIVSFALNRLFTNTHQLGNQKNGGNTDLCRKVSHCAINVLHRECVKGMDWNE